MKRSADINDIFSSTFIHFDTICIDERNTDCGHPGMGAETSGSFGSLADFLLHI